MQEEIVIEVRGGTVVEVYATTANPRVVLIDWDEIANGDLHSQVGVEFPLQPIDQMPRETREAYERGR
jgi:CO dehydrogenase nickel-insertion accessory protein CooC1